MANGEYHYCDTHYEVIGKCNNCKILIHKNWDFHISNTEIICRPCSKSRKDDEEWCEEHEQVMWKNGKKCGGCLDIEAMLSYGSMLSDAIRIDASKGDVYGNPY
jgi:hypothetical protein